MTNDELDRLAAEKIMGWKGIYLNEFGSAWILPSSSPGCVFKEREDWQPTRNIAQAWDLLEKFKHWSLCTGLHEDTQHTVFCGIGKDIGHITWEAKAETAPLAIVKACLKAKGIEV